MPFLSFLSKRIWPPQKILQLWISFCICSGFSISWLVNHQRSTSRWNVLSSTAAKLTWNQSPRTGDDVATKSRHVSVLVLAGNFAKDRIEKVTSYIACFPPLLIPGYSQRTAFWYGNCSLHRIKKDDDDPVTRFMESETGAFTYAPLAALGDLTGLPRLCGIHPPSAQHWRRMVPTRTSSCLRSFAMCSLCSKNFGLQGLLVDSCNRDLGQAWNFVLGGCREAFYGPKKSTNVRFSSMAGSGLAPISASGRPNPWQGEETSIQNGHCKIYAWSATC